MMNTPGSSPGLRVKSAAVAEPTQAKTSTSSTRHQGSPVKRESRRSSLKVGWSAPHEGRCWSGENHQV